MKNEITETTGQLKITTGFVVQHFEDGKCVSQHFVAGDQVDYENEYGETIDEFDGYFPFDMKQPEEA